MLTLSHEQYRMFAEWCKSEAGQALEISNVHAMNGGWAQSGFVAWEVIEDVRMEHACYGPEVSRIMLADSVVIRDFRRIGRYRPEINWDALADEEIYPFLIWHEIGHRRDNFHMLDVTLAGDESHTKIAVQAKWVNEILADRFAWSQIRPGEALPKTISGKRNAQLIADSIGYLEKYCERTQCRIRPIPAGQYSHVSPRMLESPRLAAFVGPDVHSNLLERYVWMSDGHFTHEGDTNLAASQPQEMAA